MMDRTLKVNTSNEIMIKADAVSFVVSVSLHEEETIDAMNQIYSAYDKILKALDKTLSENNADMISINKSAISINKHLVRVETEEGNNSIFSSNNRRVSTEYKHDGYDARGSIEIIYNIYANIDYESIYSLVAMSNDKLAVTINYDFKFSDKLISNAKTELRRKLVDAAEDIAHDIVGEYTDIKISKIAYGARITESREYGSMSKMCMMDYAAANNEAQEMIMNTAELAKRFIESDDTRPSTYISDNIEIEFAF